MTLPTGSINMLDVIEELDGTRTPRIITLNDAEVRELAGKPSGAISMNDLRGKSSVYTYNITGTNNTNLDLTSVLSSQSRCKVMVCIASGAVVYSTNTSTAALKINPLPGKTLCIINDGIIAGAGGVGGRGAAAYIQGSTCKLVGATNGANGGVALCIGHSGTIVRNNCCIQGGGAGGGGGGAFRTKSRVYGSTCIALGGGGGGGGRGYNNPSGGAGGNVSSGSEQIKYSGSAGGTGGPSQGGNGAGYSWFGASSSDRHACSGWANGGSFWGGNAGAGGALGCKAACLCLSGSGTTATLRLGPSSGGSGGKSVCGNSNITWEELGTIHGART